MRDIFFITDTHKNHSNIIKFANSEGIVSRPNPFTGNPFNDIREHNEMFFDEISKVVKPDSKVYHLGDVIFGQRHMMGEMLSRMTAIGHWRLCPGNHDQIILKSPDLQVFFEKIEIWRIFKEHGFTASHIPLNEECFRGKTVVNLHGHVHKNSLNDPRYLNICPEVRKTFAPVHIDEIIKYVKDIK